MTMMSAMVGSIAASGMQASSTARLGPGPLSSADLLLPAEDSALFPPPAKRPAAAEASAPTGQRDGLQTAFAALVGWSRPHPRPKKDADHEKYRGDRAHFDDPAPSDESESRHA
ncbi:MAG: hypothetical protein R3229_17990 [Alphaproteobacteria bacterium]|nr:hypothetical protein [Alphaproteobacteria bacterium]